MEDEVVVGLVGEDEDVGGEDEVVGGFASFGVRRQQRKRLNSIRQ